MTILVCREIEEPEEVWGVGRQQGCQGLGLLRSEPGAHVTDPGVVKTSQQRPQRGFGSHREIGWRGNMVAREGIQNALKGLEKIGIVRNGRSNDHRACREGVGELAEERVEAWGRGASGHIHLISRTRSETCALLLAWLAPP